MKVVALLIVGIHMVVAGAQTPINATADSLYMLGDYTKAINEYAKLEGGVAGLQIARSYNAIGNYEKAIIQYESLTSANSTNQLALFELGKLLLKTNEHTKATKVFMQLVGLNTVNPEYQYYLGEAKRKDDNVAASIKHYKKAIAIDETHLRSLFQLAKYYTVKQERDKALDYIERGLDLYANDVSLINLKALVLYNDYQYKNAIPWFENVLELGETKDYVYEKLADSYYHNWEFTKSKDTYKILLGRDDKNSQTYFELARVYEKEKKLDSAKLFINWAMDVQKPIFAQGYSALAEIARQQDDINEAFSYYEMAYKENSQDARIFYNVCTTYDNSGTEPEKKLAYYEKFLKEFPNEHPFYYETVKKRIKELKEQIHFSKD
ncbi:tetratricopeptide repeat protein [Maribacter sp. MAR_2009_72]|uniref:tetratricopeptide repeat protein n=1 Tax=Maribacter sp. MAR_2009_72 TaxID=1250050 RepID=UPI00119CB853|nr:tetratricopeptide repeat protein [Maribacter sp. MAR_2009_72]